MPRRQVGGGRDDPVWAGRSRLHADRTGGPCSLLVSFAVLSVGGPSARDIQHEEARRILARMDLARQEAVMQARSLGVRFERDGYLFYGARDGQWRMLEQGGLMDPHELPEALAIDVEIDGLEVELFGEDDAADGDGDDEDAVRPQIFFLAGGEIVPDFSIRILSDDTDTEYRIQPGDERWLTLSEERF